MGVTFLTMPAFLNLYVRESEDSVVTLRSADSTFLSLTPARDSHSLLTHSCT